MLRIANEILDFNDDVEMERVARVFDTIDVTSGDYSYKFNVHITSKNTRLLSYPLPDVSSKKVYKKIGCDLMDDDGDVLYVGFIRVENVNVKQKQYECSFFSGNTNWMSQLTGQVKDAGFDDYDIDINEANIVSSWNKNDGVVFRLFDSGNLITRSHNRTVPEDWSPMIYVKTIFQRIFNSHSIKIQGELLNDWAFNSMLVCSNTHNENEIDKRTSYVAQTAQYTTGTSPELFRFNDDTTYPYFNSPNVNFDLASYSYTADVKSILKLELHLEYNLFSHIYILINGVRFASVGSAGTGFFDGIKYVPVDVGDVVQLQIHPDVGVFIVKFATLRISPFFIYSVNGSDIVPKWTQQQFITDILALFNVVSDYDPYSKTVTFNLFDKISSKKSLTLPNTIQVDKIDYVDFIGKYAQNNYFGYQSDDSEEIKQYNVENFLSYGKGNIISSNDFIQKEISVVDSEFTSPISYINRPLGNLSLERTHIFEAADADVLSISGVSDNSGTARFSVGEDILIIGNVVKIEMDSTDTYNGEWVVTGIGSGYFDVGTIPYNGGDTGKATLQITKTTSNDNVYIFLDTGAQSYIDFTTLSSLYIGNNAYTQIGYSYFNLLNINKPINSKFKQSLAFGASSNILNYQRTLLDSFWKSFKRILNDPVKPTLIAYIPKKLFKDMTPLIPVEIKTEETVNQYYINRITSYKNSYTQSTVELIKL